MIVKRLKTYTGYGISDSFPVKDPTKPPTKKLVEQFRKANGLPEDGTVYVLANSRATIRLIYDPDYQGDA